MGWYFSPQSRYELIAELIAPQETERASVKVIAHALRGNVLWSVAEVTARAEGGISMAIPPTAMPLIIDLSMCCFLSRRFFRCAI